MVSKLLLGLTPRAYLRSLATPFDLLAGFVVLLGLFLIAFRFAYGLGSVTNLGQVNAWGLWKGLNVITGVALGAGGYTLACAVYIFGLTEYRPVVRVGVLAGFMAYLFAVIGLLVDIGQPWRIPYPLVYSFGVTSVMFEVAWCMCLYLAVLLFEFSPAVLEWLGLPVWRARVTRVAVGFVAFGVVLSSLHQPSLGALFLMAPSKLHPLWYSRYLPILFFVSSIVAGLCMVVVISALGRRFMPSVVSPQLRGSLDRITIGLCRGVAFVLLGYFFLKLQALADGSRWSLLGTGWGHWYLLELLGFVALPCAILAVAGHRESATLGRAGAALALLGVVLNRLNVSVIALNWNVTPRYVPSAAEVAISLSLVTLGVLGFRWIAYRMPVFHVHPDFADGH